MALRRWRPRWRWPPASFRRASSKSTLRPAADGTFTFTYVGQIYLLALSKLAEMSAKAESGGDFIETPCYNDDDFKERPCTEEEIAEQREAWEPQAEARRQQAEREAEAMQAVPRRDRSLPTPKAAEELAAAAAPPGRLEARSTTAATGCSRSSSRSPSTLGHDFVFPTHRALSDGQQLRSSPMSGRAAPCASRRPGFAGAGRPIRSRR